jgi:uncharacterized protein (DUF3084 family)
MTPVALVVRGWVMAVSKAQRAATAARRANAIKLRLAGLDYETIAQRLDYSSKGSACTDITRALAASIKEQGRSADELREVELARLDRLQAAAWGPAVGGELRAIETVLRVIDRRCKLLGLDAPIRAEVLTIDDIDAQIRVLKAEHDRAAEAGETAGAAGPEGGG